MTLEQALYQSDAAAPLGIDVLGDEHPNPNQDGRARYTPRTAAEIEQLNAEIAEFAKRWEIKK